MIFVGFDPGGLNAFGWAVVEIDANWVAARVETGVTSSAPDALDAVTNRLKAQPAAVGIDAPLYWVMKGDRAADAIVRRKVIAAGGVSGTVGSVNSLRGACLVQGVLIARLASEAWPSAALTEAHPKALLLVDTVAKSFSASCVSERASEHERDAVLAAYAAGRAVDNSRGWTNLCQWEKNVVYPVGRPVAYWFPDENRRP